uniref:FXYD domain-containing ion transport regulator n=1 Tax=Oreochromis niloticus TaxID=8128 RepID=A0A669DFQ6_ORENI
MFHCFCFVISDYESLRIGGLVFAVVLFFLGIAIIVSKCMACNWIVFPVCTNSPRSPPQTDL